MTWAALGRVLMIAASAEPAAGEEPALPVWVFPLGFGVFFAIMWVLVCIMISRMGGWSSLAAAYRCPGAFEGRRWRFKNGTLRRFAGYNNCLTVGANEEGLYLAVMFLFRPGHPPLFIPWSDITVETKADKMLFVSFTFVEFRSSRVPEVPLRLQEKLARQIAVALGKPLSESRPPATDDDRA